MTTIFFNKYCIILYTRNNNTMLRWSVNESMLMLMLMNPTIFLFTFKRFRETILSYSNLDKVCVNTFNISKYF